MKNHKKINEKFAPKQSDIVIKPDGKVYVSFLWDDLQDLISTKDTYQFSNEFKKQNYNLKKFLVEHEKTNFFTNELLSEYSNCKMCPLDCGYDRVSYSHLNCGDYKFRISTYGTSYGDEDCIKGSRGSGVIMLGGCPLTCYSCHNPEMVRESNVSNPLDFLKICDELQSKGVHNIQILSPTVHLPVLIKLLEILKNSDFSLPIIFKSSGFESLNYLRALEGLIDVYIPDLKFGSCSKLGNIAGAKNYFEEFRPILEEMIRQVGKVKLNVDSVIESGVIARHVNAPISKSENIEIKNFLDNYSDDILISFNDNFVSFVK